MHAHDLLINDAADRHAIEDVTELFPKLDVVPTLALIVKSIDARDGCAFVISTELEKVLWVLALVSEHEDDCF